MPQRAGSMPNVHQNSEPDRNGACAMDVRVAICNLAMMRQSRDQSRAVNANSLAPQNASDAANRCLSASSSRGVSPVGLSRHSAKMAGSGTLNGAPYARPDHSISSGSVLSRSQHNLSHNGALGRSSLLQSARAECQPYLLRPPTNESQWRRTNSDSALHQSAVAAEQQQQNAQQAQQQQQAQFYPQFTTRPSNPFVAASSSSAPPTSLANSSSPCGWHDSNTYNISPNLTYPPNSYSPNNQPNETFSPFPNIHMSAQASHPTQQPAHGQQQVQQSQQNVRRVQATMLHSLSPSMNPSLVASSECLASPSPNYNGLQSFSSNNAFLLANNLTSRFGGSHGVGLEMLGTNYSSPTSPSANDLSAPPAQSLLNCPSDVALSPCSQGPPFANHERPRSCDLPTNHDPITSNCSLPNSALNSQLSSPLSMQPSPVHSPPSYASGGLPSPQPVPSSFSANPLTRSSLSSPPLVPSQSQPTSSSATALPTQQSSSQRPIYSACNTGPPSVSSTTLSSAGSPPQLIPQSPQSHGQQPLLNDATSPAALDDALPLDLDGLDECFSDLPNGNLFSPPTSPQSPSSAHASIVINKSDAVIRICFDRLIKST